MVKKDDDEEVEVDVRDNDDSEGTAQKKKKRRKEKPPEDPWKHLMLTKALLSWADRVVAVGPGRKPIFTAGIYEKTEA